MSRSQAHIERGFSVNKEIVFENLRSKCPMCPTHRL